MKEKLLFLLISLMLAGVSSLAQSDTKREFEQSVKPGQVPEAILNVLTPFIEQGRRIKYFKESDGENISWEIKMRYQGRQFSIEFYEDSRLKNIEELVGWNRLERGPRNSLGAFFESNYQRFRIKRFQKQYIPDKDQEVGTFISKVLSVEGLPPDGYEVEAEVRSKETREFGFFEYLFDQDFQLISKRKIIPVPDGNLLF